MMRSFLRIGDTYSNEKMNKIGRRTEQHQQESNQVSSLSVFHAVRRPAESVFKARGIPEVVVPQQDWEHPPVCSPALWQRRTENRTELPAAWGMEKIFKHKGFTCPGSLPPSSSGVGRRGPISCKCKGQKLFREKWAHRHIDT